MSVEQREQRPTLEQVNQDLQRSNRSLGRANDLLTEPGGKSWPRFYQLDNLPTNTTNEQVEFIRRSARVADRFVPKIAEVTGRLEIKVEDLRLQVVEGRLEVIKASVERRQQGQPGLPNEVLQKAEIIVEDLKARRDQRLLEAQPKKPIEAEEPAFEKGARRDHLELELKNGIRVIDLGGRLADVLVALDRSPNSQLTRRELAAAVWTGMPIEKALKNLDVTLRSKKREVIQKQGIDVMPIPPSEKGEEPKLGLVRLPQPVAEIPSEVVTEPEEQSPVSLPPEGGKKK